MQSRRLQELADGLRLRHIPSFYDLDLEAQRTFITACFEAVRDPEIRSQASFDELRWTMPRPIGDEVCSCTGLHLLVWAMGAQVAGLSDLAIDLMARVRVLSRRSEVPLNLNAALQERVLRQAEIVEFFWLDETPWNLQPEGRRQNILRYLYHQAYAGKRQGLPESDRPLHERLGSHEIDDKLYRLSVRNKAVLNDLIGAFGAMLFHTAVSMQMNDLPPAAMPFVASHIARASKRGEDLFATDGITLELNRQLVNYRGKTADSLWLA